MTSMVSGSQLRPTVICMLVVLLPSVYFLLIFWPALAQGKVYGNLPNQQRLAVELNNYHASLTPELAKDLYARIPEVIHPDYELLYRPTEAETQIAFQHKRLPLYNLHRILGTTIWGSPVGDAANPLTWLLLLMSPDAVRLVEIYVYTVLGFAGVYRCATHIFEAAPLPALTGGSLYVLAPFMYYMYHWIMLYGVVCLVPNLFWAVHEAVTRPRFRSLALVQLLFAWMLLINQLQAMLYFALFLVAWWTVGRTCKVYDSATLRRGLPWLAVSFVGGAALTLGYTWYELLAGSSLERAPHTYSEFSSAWHTLLSPGLLLAMWTTQSPLPYFQSDSLLPFFPFPVLAAILAALTTRPRFSGGQATLGILLVLMTVHIFVYPLHLPLYLLHLPLYNLNWEHWRVVYLFNLLLALLAAVALTSLAATPKQSTTRKGLAILFGLGAIAYAVAAATSPAVRLALDITSAMGLAILGHGCYRRFSTSHVALLSLCIVAASVYMPMTRVPFYQPAAAIAPAAATAYDGVRTMRLLDLESMMHPRSEVLWLNDSVMAMFNRNGTTGYDTALTRKQADLFNVFYDQELRRMRANVLLLLHGVQSSIVWPEAQGILEPTGTIGPVSLARLELLGVGRLLWGQPIKNLPTPSLDRTFRMWSHALPDPSPVSLLAGTNEADIARLYSDYADAELAARLVSSRRAAPVSFDEGTGTLRASLPAGTGLVVVAYDVDGFYRPFLNGVQVRAEPGHLPFLMLRKQSEEPALLELRPYTNGIWRTTALGLALGLALLASLWRWCPRR